MKKRLIYLAAVVLAAGCAQREIEPAGPAMTTISVGLEGAKTSLGDVDGGNRHILWTTGDQIVCNGVTSLPLAEAFDGQQSASFSFEGSIDAPYNVVYPADYFDVSGNLSLPKVVRDGIFPLKGSGTGAITLSIQSAMVRLSIKQKPEGDAHKIKYLDVTTNSGTVRVVVNKPTSTETPLDVYVPVVAGETSLTVKVIDDNGHFMTKSTSSSKTLTNGVILFLPAFEFEPTGTQMDIEINSAAAWNSFADQYNANPEDNNLFVSVTADLDFTGVDAKVIGDYAGNVYFEGMIDGGGHKISNLKSSHELIAAVGHAGLVKDLAIDETCIFNVAYTPGVSKHFGPFAEYVKGTVQGCSNMAPITLDSSVANDKDLFIGGIAGRVREGVIANCVNQGKITLAGTYSSTANLYAGGICGWVSNADGVISSCVNQGSFENAAVAKNVFMGGIAGKSAGNLEACVNDAPMNATTVRASGDPCKFILMGGMVAEAAGGTVKACVNSGPFTTSQTVKQYYAGGIAARDVGNDTAGTKFEQNTSSGDITITKGLRNAFVGGLFGALKADNTIELDGSPFTGKISIRTHENSTTVYLYAGGIAGVVANEVWLKGDSCSVDCDITMPLSANAAKLVCLGGVVGGAGDDGSGTAQGKAIKITGFTTSGMVKVPSEGTSTTPTYVMVSLGGILGNSLSGVTVSGCSSSADVYFADANPASKSNGKTVHVGGIVGCVKPASGDSASEISSCSFTGNAYNFSYNNNIVWPSEVWTGNCTGGIIGSYAYQATNDVPLTISDCTSDGPRYAYRGAAGSVAGFLSKTTVSGCTVPSGKVNRGAPAGGIAGAAVGCVLSGCSVKLSEITGETGGSAVADAGGILGYATGTSVDGCKAFSTITSSNKLAGGIIGCPDSACTIGGTAACMYGGSVAGNTIDAGNTGTYAIGNSEIASFNVSFWNGE